MLEIRIANERGHANHGWLDTWHSFSFADYHDPQYMGFRHLRVINEDWVSAGHGFAPHFHRDMEIVTYVLEGQLEHKDSMGNTSLIVPGDIQRMTAGTGVTHSEINPSRKDPLHLLQIWIMPEANGLKPGYEQKKFPDSEKQNAWRLIAAGNPEQGAIKIHQNIRIFSSLLEKGKALDYKIRENHYVWVQVARGNVRVNGEKLEAGFGAALTEEPEVTVAAEENAELLLFDMA